MYIDVMYNMYIVISSRYTFRRNKGAPNVQTEPKLCKCLGNVKYCIC